ncbi:YbdD/YjiX family protein [Azospirillum sp. B510]|uniref:YbdD/YjiX family protein n=1 Tax=Azospirillum sp. (strain B510) TaxID=137722 RepID=UPI0005A7A603
MKSNLSRFRGYFEQTAKLMIGVPDYDRYVAHMGERHPDKPVMTYQEFLDNRLEARYGAGKAGCC